MKYFAIIDERQCGPFRLEELPGAGVTPDTLVWCKEMKEWTPASKVADICRFYRRYLSGRSLIAVLAQEDADSRGLAGGADGVDKGSRAGEIDKSDWRYILSETKINKEPDYSVPPSSPLALAVLSTIFCFPFTGFIAVYFCWKTRRLWEDSQQSGLSAAERDKLRRAAHEYSRRGGMLIGLTLSIGLVMMAIAYRMVDS